jgi:hypothetical protein
MVYRVRVGPGTPEVVDQTGDRVPHAHVKSITFPGNSITGPNGKENYISGPGKAVIVVEGQQYVDVALCS